MKTISLILMLVLLNGCVDKLDEISKISIFVDEPEDVSLIALIAAPNKFNNELVRVVGYFKYEFENISLFVSKESSENSMYKNGLWVEFAGNVEIQPPFGIGEEKVDLSYFDSTYVLVEGVFDKNMKGHMNMNSGSIRSVTRIMSIHRN